MGQKVVQVDAFTNRPFGGNPAAVCVMEGPAEEGWMQGVALEMNLSETAFLYPEPADQGAYRLRWFTPKAEVDLCGHATLATAHALWSEGHLDRSVPARFHTKSGPLTATLRDGWITLDLPATPLCRPGASPVRAEPDELARVFGGEVEHVGFSKFDGFVVLATERALRELRADTAAVAALPVRGVIVTAKAETPGFDFVSRFFAPSVGVDEDPVCGSAHCCLGPYWGERLGKSDLVAYQASPRGGVLKVGLRGDRIYLSGQAVTTLRGELAC